MINKKDFSPEQLALYKACHAIPPNMPEIRQLLDAGVSPDIKYNTDDHRYEQDLLQDVIENYSFLVSLSEMDDNVLPNTYCKFYPELVELLCSHGADPNYSADSIYCLWNMRYAPDNEYSAEIVETLLKYGADPNCEDEVAINLYEEVHCDIYYEKFINHNDSETWQPKFLQLIAAHGGQPHKSEFHAYLLPDAAINFSDLADLSRYAPRFEKSDEGDEYTLFIYDVKTGKNVAEL